MITCPGFDLHHFPAIKAAVALKEIYECDGTSTRQHNEPAGNQDAFHFHLHVFPRYKGDNLYINHEDTFWPTEEEKEPYAEKLKKYFKKKADNKF